MLEREREMKHTHLERWTCASGKWVIPRHKWSSHYRIAYGWKTLSMDLSSKLSKILMKAKSSRGAFLFFSFLFFFYYFSFLLLFFLFFFIHYFSSLFLFFHSPFFMLLRTTCYSSPPPCLDDCSSSSIEVRGPMAAREVQNPCIPL
jgi:hypothetical protein